MQLYENIFKFCDSLFQYKLIENHKKRKNYETKERNI